MMKTQPKSNPKDISDNWFQLFSEFSNRMIGERTCNYCNVLISNSRTCNLRTYITFWFLGNAVWGPISHFDFQDMQASAVLLTILGTLGITCNLVIAFLHCMLSNVSSNHLPEIIIGVTCNLVFVCFCRLFVIIFVFFIIDNVIIFIIFKLSPSSSYLCHCYPFRVSS